MEKTLKDNKYRRAPSLVCLYFKKLSKKKLNLETRGIDPLTFRMQSGRSTTELHPHVLSISRYSFFKNVIEQRANFKHSAAMIRANAL